MPITPIQGGCDGYATGYWDCCKPHCGWKGNVPGGTNPLSACDRADNSLGSNVDAMSACGGGNAYQCHSLVPWAIDDKVSSCMNVFEAHGLGELAAGCAWFIEWFQVADNPTLKYRQVACPAELMNKGLRRTGGAANSCLR